MSQPRKARQFDENTYRSRRTSISPHTVHANYSQSTPSLQTTPSRSACPTLPAASNSSVPSHNHHLRLRVLERDLSSASFFPFPVIWREIPMNADSLWMIFEGFEVEGPPWRRRRRGQWRRNDSRGRQRPGLALQRLSSRSGIGPSASTRLRRV